MRDTKYCIPQFTFYDRTGIRAFLEHQAEDGWLLDKIGSFLWRFRRIQPKRLRFAVTYFPAASAFDPGPSDAEQTFREFCAHAGWKLAASSAQLQIFWNEDPDPVPIETDPVMELENIHSSVKRSYLLSQWMLLAVAVMQLGLIVYRLATDLVSTLASNANLFTIFSYFMLLTMCALEISGYYRWRRRALTAARKDGVFLETRGRRSYAYWILLVVCLAFLAMLWSMGSPGFVLLGLGGPVMMFLMVAVLLGASTLMKKLGASGGVNRAVTIALTVVLSVGMVTLVIVSVMRNRDTLLEDEPVETYEYGGMTWEIYDDPLPLTLADLGLEQVDTRYSKQKTGFGSLLLSEYQYIQRTLHGDPDTVRFWYSVVEVKADIFYEAALKNMLDTSDHGYSVDIYGNSFREEYRMVDAAPWGAERAYRTHYQDEWLNSFILCYDGVIVELDPSWELTEAEMAIVGQIFDKEEIT